MPPKVESDGAPGQGCPLPDCPAGRALTPAPGEPWRGRSHGPPLHAAGAPVPGWRCGRSVPPLFPPTSMGSPGNWSQPGTAVLEGTPIPRAPDFLGWRGLWAVSGFRPRERKPCCSQAFCFAIWTQTRALFRPRLPWHVVRVAHTWVWVPRLSPRTLGFCVCEGKRFRLPAVHTAPLRTQDPELGLRGPVLAEGRGSPEAAAPLAGHGAASRGIRRVQAPCRAPGLQQNVAPRSSRRDSHKGRGTDPVTWLVSVARGLDAGREEAPTPRLSGNYPDWGQWLESVPDRGHGLRRGDSDKRCGGGE